MKQIFLSIFICMFVFSNGFSQKYFVEMAENPSQMSNKQKMLYDKFTNSNPNSTNYVISIAPLKDAVSENGDLRISVPYLNCEKPRFRAKWVEYKSEEDYTWIGEIPEEDTCSCWRGELTIVSRHGAKQGSLNIDGVVYSINDLTDGFYLMSKPNQENLENLRCGNNNESTGIEDQTAEQKVEKRSVMSNCDVRVLFFFTPSAQGITNVNTTIDLALANANQAFRNSNINTTSLTLLNAGVLPFNLVETDSPQDDVVDFLTSPIVQFERTERGADLVFLLTNSPNNYNGIAGLVAANPIILPAVNNSFGLFEADFVATTNVFAHEVGHLFGCLHENCDVDDNGLNNPPCDNGSTSRHGHYMVWKEKVDGNCFKQQKVAHTIMYSTMRPEAIPNFSNPNVKFRGQKTGIVNKSNNSLRLIQQACTVGGFFNTNNPTLSATISMYNGSSFNCFGAYVTLGITITGGAPGAMNVIWEKSYDGINYLFHGTGTSASVYLPTQSKPYNTFMRVTITDSAGNSFSSFTSFGAGKICGNMTDNLTNNNISNPTPNPSQSSFEINFEVLTESNVTITLVDNLGNIVFNYDNGKLETGKYVVPIDVSNYTDGFYFCNIKIGNELVTKKIIVQK